MSFLKFFVKEDDRDFPVCHMSEPESAAIAECVNDLVPSKYEMLSTSFWFETDVCLLDEEDEQPSFGLLRCYTYNQTAKNDSLDESRIPYPIPEDVVTSLAGKTFRVNPRQLGLNPWGVKVEITFESTP
jgi:hypothetical protein